MSVKIFLEVKERTQDLLLSNDLKVGQKLFLQFFEILHQKDLFFQNKA